MSVLSITFVLYILIIFTIGICSYFFTKSLNDYMIGGRSLKPSIVALGAGASDMSSWLLMGLPGSVMINGLNQIWLPISLALGAYINWKVTAKKLRIYTEIANDAITIPGYFENRFHDHKGSLRLLTAIVILIFFTCYTASGFVAGGLLFSSTFNIKYSTGLSMTSLIILTYTCIGGFLGISWIDFFQGCLMFVALIILPLYVIYYLYNLDKSLFIVSQQYLNYLNVFENTKLLAIISLFSWGLGYFGQPHILVRFMAIKNINTMNQAQVICMTWMSITLLGAIFTGLLGIAFFESGTLKNPEIIFIALSNALFNSWFAGILLATVLSAIMSTASAQLIASSSAIVEDIYHKFLRKKSTNFELLCVSRIVIFIIALVAMTLAWDPRSSILHLVSYAWAGLGSSFGPLVLFSLFWRRTTLIGAFSGIIVGAFTIITWSYFNNFVKISQIYALLPGFIFSSITIIIVSLLSKPPSVEVQQQFDKVKRVI